MELLYHNLYVFAWYHQAMEKIGLKVIYYQFNIDLSTWPKQQRRRPLNPKRYETLYKAVENLLGN